MAKDTQAAVGIEQLATRLFADRTARNPSGRATEATVLACYRDAETFMQTIAKIQAGELSPAAPAGPQLADASCPNLKPTHPLNMVSSRYGNLKRVQDLHAKLAADPKIEELPDLDWGKQEVLTAREVFPHFAGSTN
jgi:hypothetical protein